jgi:hypothetical protein
VQIYCNPVALLPMNSSFLQTMRGGVLAWSAWLRVIVVTPLLALLWLGVWWASLEGAPL